MSSFAKNIAECEQALDDFLVQELGLKSALERRIVLRKYLNDLSQVEGQEQEAGSDEGPEDYFG